MRKLFSLYLLILLCLGLSGKWTPQVKANPSEWVTVWEDDFTDLSNIYAHNYSNIEIVDGTYVFGNKSQYRIRGLHTLPVFNVTIEFYPICASGSSTDWYFGLRTGTAYKQSTTSTNMSKNDPVDIGAYVDIYSNNGTGIYKVKVWKWWTTTLISDQFDFTNQTDNTLIIHWDGVNHNVSYTMNGVYLGEWSFYGKLNRTGDINPFIFDGELELWHSWSPEWGGLKINKVTQQVQVPDSKVIPCAGKILGFGFDAVYNTTYNNALSVLDSFGGRATLFVDYYYTKLWETSNALNYTMLKWLIENRNWEAGLHTYQQLKDYDNDTACEWLTKNYNWVYGNLTYRPLFWCAMAHSQNWTHDIQYGWETHNLISRIGCSVPIFSHTSNESVGGHNFLTESRLGWFQWALNASMNGGGVRSTFCYTHKVDDPVPNADQDISTTSLTYLLGNATNDGYRILPFNEGYMALLNTYNSTFPITESTSERLVFLVSSGGYDVYVWAKKPSGSGTWYVYDDLNRKVKVWENLSDKIGFWVEHGRTYDVRSTKIHGSIESCSPHYAEITLSSLTGRKLIFTVDAPSGTTSTIQVYCGNKGEPKDVEGATSWTYNDDTKIASILVSHASSQSVTVSWGGGTLGVYDLRVHVSKNTFFFMGAIVSVNGENKTTDIFGDARFEVGYGFHDVTVFLEDQNQTREIFVSADQSVAFNFDVPFQTDRTIYIYIVIPLGFLIVIVVIFFLWGKK